MLGYAVSKSFTFILKVKEVGICITLSKQGFPRKAPRCFLMHDFSIPALAHYKEQQTHYGHINAIFVSCFSWTRSKHFITKMYEVPYERNSSSSVH